MKRTMISCLFTLFLSLVFLLPPLVGCARASGGGGDRLANAAKSGDVEAVKSIIASGADVNATDSFGNWALENAAAFGHTGCVRALIDAGADVNETNKIGDTALGLRPCTVGLTASDC